MDKELLENMTTWKSVGMLITVSKGMMNHWEAGRKTPDEIMRAFGAGETRPHCEDCKHNWACIPFCHYTWHPEERESYAMHRGFIPRDVYVGKTPCPHFERA